MATVIPSDKQIVLIVGGSQGIGLSLVTQALNGTGSDFMNKDCLVVATGRKVEQSEGLQQLKTEYGERLYLESVDAADPDSIKAFVDLYNEKYPRLDVLLYNAGSAFDKPNPTNEYSLLDAGTYFQTHIVNVLGPQAIFFGLRQIIEATHKLLGGKVDEKPVARADDAEKDDMTKVRVIFVSSMMGSMGVRNFYAMPHYCTSKAALNQIARDIAVKFPYLGCFVMHPGYVSTRLTNNNGDITPEVSAAGIYSSLTKEAFAVNSMKHLLCYDGSRMPW